MKRKMFFIIMVRPYLHERDHGKFSVRIERKNRSDLQSWRRSYFRVPIGPFSPTVCLHLRNVERLILHISVHMNAVSIELIRL